MNTQSFVKVFGIALLMTSGDVLAQTQVPNTFTSGTPARAAEVNANFDALEAAIAQNATDIQAIPAGSQGPQGIQGDQGPAGADLSNEVSILQGEQAVQNDRIDTLESSDVTNTSDIASNSAGIQNNTNVIDALVVANGIQVYSQGVSIGKLIQFNDSRLYYSSRMTLVSDKGYMFLVFAAPDPSNILSTSQIWFSDPNCMGTAMKPMGFVEASLGLVFTATGPIPTYYAPRGSGPPRSMGYQSFYRTTTPPLYECVNESASRIEQVVVFPNDLATTGVSDLEPVQPLTIGAP